ncbi:MAG TPA: glucose 1-dehydrogenase [Solirubrobacterales bacterium]|nr:glucose 1-dehydrogenase [Solirubrobacterales bacterium]
MSPDPELGGQVAIVTGAARGIGAAIAARLARCGARVVVADIDLAAAEELAADDDRLTARQLDVADWDAVHQLVADTWEREGRLDVFVNNAALTIARDFWQLEPAEWDEVMAVNLRGTLAGTRAAGERMRTQGSGRIVNLSSLAGHQGSVANGAHYSASKAGIIVLTKIAATELAPHHVTVNAVAPAAIAGPQLDALPPERRESIAAKIPLGRLGHPDEVAAAVAFLASEEAAYITGATLDLNGGLFMR